MTARDALRGAAFIAWVDYGSEGWRPTVFQSAREVTEWIEDGGSHGSRFVVTRGPLDLTMADAEANAPGADGKGGRP